MSKKKAYVIGTNVSTSLSPVIFDYWFKKYNIDAEYNYIKIKEENFDQEIQSILKTEGLIGLNITIPFKEKILPYLTDKKKGQEIWNGNNVKRSTIENLTSFLGSPINCLTINKNKVIGTNTDGFGFGKAYFKHIETKKDPPLKGQLNYSGATALVLGFGGAAKSIISSLVEMNFDTIIVFNRTYKKIQNIGNAISEYEPRLIPSCEIVPEKIENLIKYTDFNKSKQTKLIINTSPKNILNNKTNWNIGKGVTGFDIVYRPREGTGFLNCFQPENRIEGINMLIYQAAPCFKLWFGLEPEIEEGLFNVLYKKMEKFN